MGWAQTTHPLQLYRASSQIQIFTLEMHQLLYWVLSLLAAVKVCVSLHAWKADVPHLSCTQQGGLCMPENSQPGLCATARPSHTMAWHTHWSPCTSRIRTFLLSLHLSQDTTKVLQDLSISIIPPSRKQISTYRNRKEKQQRRKKMLFIIKEGNLKVILHNGNTKAGSLHKTITQDLLFPSQEIGI